VYAKSPYQAHRTVHLDASASGSHLSGDPRAPMVHEDRDKRLTADQRKAIWSAAIALDPSLLNRDDKAPQDSYNQLTLKLRDGRKAVIVWRSDESPAPSVQRLTRALSETGIGAW
jgi:hypothetical protein